GACGSRARFGLGDAGLVGCCGGAPAELAASDEGLHVFHADHFLGSAAGLNVVLKQARGRHIVTLDTSVEVKGDIFTPSRKLLEDSRVGIAGRWGVTSGDLRSFEEAEESGD